MIESNADNIPQLTKLLEENNRQLLERERDLADKTEELLAQKEELTAAVEELMNKNESLSKALTQLQDRNHELDQILYRTSHDLRTPLSSIRGIVNLLKLESESASVQEYRNHIEDKVNQMDDLLRSLSSLSKAILENPALSIVDVEALIPQIIDELLFTTPKGKVKVSWKLPEPRIKTDSFLMVIILRSLLSNAFTFRDALSSGLITITAAKVDTHYVLEVTDDGEGIEASVLPHIFEMFYRGSERSRGSGLGLYVARKAVEHLQGTIEVATIPGKTSFIVRLPLLK